MTCCRCTAFPTSLPNDLILTLHNRGCRRRVFTLQKIKYFNGLVIPGHVTLTGADKVLLPNHFGVGVVVFSVLFYIYNFYIKFI